MPSTRVCHIKQPGPAPPTASCYICLENSADDNNQPLLRNCACRGDAGWAHIACLAEFAASQVTETQRKQDHSVNILSLWNKCILCKTLYMQNMALAMADAFVKHYEHLPDTNDLRFHSLSSLAMCRFNVGDHDDALALYDRLRHTCAFLTSTGFDTRKEEANMYNMMGLVFMKKGQHNDALLAFERQRELYVAVYGPNSPKVEENNKMIVTLKERIEIGRGHQKRDTAAALVRVREVFRENQECVEIRNKLNIHLWLVQALKNDGKIQECMEQFENLLAESRQTLGPDHPDTLRFENDAEKYQFKTPMASNSSAAAGAATSQKKEVWAVIDCEQQPAISGQRVQVLRATKDGQKYICLIKNDKGVSTKFKVTRNQFILEAGTAVVVHGLVSSADLNGSIGFICSFDEEKHRYAVSVGKKKTAVSIKPINLNVDFTY